VQWTEAASQIAQELDAEIKRLREENTKLKVVTPSHGIFTSEFLVTAGGFVTVAIMGAQGQIAEFASTLSPQWGGLLNIIVTLIVAGGGGAYVASRKDVKAKEEQAKKQILGG